MAPEQTTLDVSLPAPQRGPDHGNTRALRDALRDHFIKPGETYPGGVFLIEVEAPGPGTVRRADGVYLGFTSTPGWCIDVCEVKVSRADLMREIAQPTKADAWWSYSTRFWIVSPSALITPPDDLPEGWGLMCPKTRGRRFAVHREPAVRDPLVDLPLLITLAKKLDTQRVEMVAEARRAAAREYQVKADEQWREWRADNTRMDSRSRQRLELLDQVERLADRELREWQGSGNATPEEFAAAMALALDVVTTNDRAGRAIGTLLRQVESVRGRAADLAEALGAAQAAHEKLTDPPTPNGGA